MIAVREDFLASWRGGEEVDSEGNEIEEEETDYWRACEITDQVGLIDLTGRDMLVLNSGPLRTTYVSESSLFVQQVAKPARTDLLGAIDDALPRVAWRDMFYWKSGGDYVLFDAAAAGDEISESDRINFSLPPGRTLVRIANVEPAPELDVWVNLVQLVPQG